MSRATEFLFSWNFAELSTVLAGDIGDKYGMILWRSSGYCTWFHHEIHGCHSGSDGRNTENIELSLSEILPVNLVDRLHLSVAVTGDKDCIFGGVQRPQKIYYYMWKICHGEPWNLANWATEFGEICHGKLCSLVINGSFWRCFSNISLVLPVPYLTAAKNRRDVQTVIATP